MFCFTTSSVFLSPLTVTLSSFYQRAFRGDSWVVPPPSLPAGIPTDQFLVPRFVVFSLVSLFSLRLSTFFLRWYSEIDNDNYNGSIFQLNSNSYNFATGWSICVTECIVSFWWIPSFRMTAFTSSCDNTAFSVGCLVTGWLLFKCYTTKWQL